MDWHRAHDRPRREEEPPRELLDVWWLMKSRYTGRVLECGIYRVASGLEVRVGYGPDDLLHSQLAADLDAAHAIADALGKAVLNKGGFRELPLPLADGRSLPRQQ